MRAPALLASGAVLLSWCLGGCTTGPVGVVLPERATDPACTGLQELWPRDVSGRTQRPVSVTSPAARAWGDPPIVAVCGYPPPPPSTLECLGVDGVDWLIQRRSDGVQFITYGRSPALEVLVPSAYAPEPLLLPAFGPAARALPQTGRHCS